LIPGAFGKVKKALKKLKTWAKGKFSGMKKALEKLHDNFKIAIEKEIATRTCRA
jgi:hypothetical protein